MMDYFGPTDFTQIDTYKLPESPLERDRPDSPKTLLIQVPIQENIYKAVRANPITYIISDTPLSWFNCTQAAQNPPTSFPYTMKIRS
jgi:hypothetical protein